MKTLVKIFFFLSYSHGFKDRYFIANLILKKGIYSSLCFDKQFGKGILKKDASHGQQKTTLFQTEKECSSAVVF